MPRNIVILKHPSHRRLVMALVGVIYAIQSEIGIDGDTMFTNNSAENHGGEKELGTWVVLNTMLRIPTVVLASKEHCFSH